MDRDRIEGIRHRSRRRYEMGFAESDIDFLLKCFDELEAELKLEKHQHIGTTSACQTNGKLCDQWKADCEQLQSRIKAGRNWMDGWAGELEALPPRAVDELREALGGNDE